MARCLPTASTQPIAVPAAARVEAFGWQRKPLLDLALSVLMAARANRFRAVGAAGAAWPWSLPPIISSAQRWPTAGQAGSAAVQARFSFEQSVPLELSASTTGACPALRR